jgi:hypothetical protein
MRLPCKASVETLEHLLAGALCTKRLLSIMDLMIMLICGFAEHLKVSKQNLEMGEWLIFLSTKHPVDPVSMPLDLFSLSLSLVSNPSKNL